MYWILGRRDCTWSKRGRVAVYSRTRWVVQLKLVYVWSGGDALYTVQCLFSKRIGSFDDDLERMMCRHARISSAGI